MSSTLLDIIKANADKDRTLENIYKRVCEAYAPRQVSKNTVNKYLSRYSITYRRGVQGDPTVWEPVTTAERIAYCKPWIKETDTNENELDECM